MAAHAHRRAHHPHRRCAARVHRPRSLLLGAGPLLARGDGRGDADPSAEPRRGAARDALQRRAARQGDPGARRRPRHRPQRLRRRLESPRGRALQLARLHRQPRRDRRGCGGARVDELRRFGPGGAHGAAGGARAGRDDGVARGRGAARRAGIGLARRGRPRGPARAALRGREHADAARRHRVASLRKARRRAHGLRVRGHFGQV